MKSFIVFILILSFSVTPIQAEEKAKTKVTVQEKEKEKTKAKDSTPFFFKGVQKEVFPNGLTVITLEKKDFPIVAVNIFINTGGINEDEKISGISHFCEHLFYRGTQKRTGIELKKEIEELGGVFNAETSKDMTRYFLTVPADYGLQALEIYCDSAINANYDPESIEQERKVILEEYNLTRQNPMVIIRDKLYSLAFSKHPYEKSVIGTVETIKSFTREDFISYKKRFYSPENMTIVLVGNFNRNKYISFLKDFFKDIPGGTPYRSNHYANDPLPHNKEVVEVGDFPSSRAFFTLAFRSPGILDREDVLAMDMLIFMLGNGKNSTFSRELGRRQKLTDDMNADFLTSRDPGLVIFSAQVDPDKITVLKESVLKILEDYKQGGFTEEEMTKARNLLLKTYIYGSETTTGKADALGFYETLTDMDFALNYIKGIERLKKEDIIRVANKYFGENYVMYVMKPKPQQHHDE